MNRTIPFFTLKNFCMTALAAVFILTSCKKIEPEPEPKPEPEPADPEIVIEQTEYTLDATGNRTATVSFTTTADWTITISEDADWLTATPANGTAGSHTVELAATENVEQTERTAHADIACGDKTVQITVTQAGTPAETDFTSLFDTTFAYALQMLEIIPDAEKITQQDMDNIAAVTELDLTTFSITHQLTSMKGIEYFKSLTYLNCSWNMLTTLDISKNTALTELHVDNNLLTSLDVSKNTALQYLECGRNDLKSLDMSNNPELKRLRCFGNYMTSLDLSNNPSIEYLDCSINELTSLDVSTCVKLSKLYCYSNYITSLDISNNQALETLYCSSCELTSLDISKTTALRDLACQYNPGDRESTFPITAWFEKESLVPGFSIGIDSWYYDGKAITVKFQLAE